MARLGRFVPRWFGMATMRIGLASPCRTRRASGRKCSRFATNGSSHGFQCYTCVADFEGPIMLAIRLPQDIEERLDKLAQRTGRTKSYYARQAILEHLADLEDVYSAETRFEELRSGRKRSVPISRLMKRYGLDD